jgi:hypothetical protein
VATGSLSAVATFTAGYLREWVVFHNGSRAAVINA